METADRAERWRRARAILEDALEVDLAERDAFVARACGDDRELRREVLSLLAADTAARAGGSALPDDDALAEWLERQLERTLVGHRVGGFLLRRLLASGGTGSVYEAEQEHPRRAVALKVMRHGFLSEAARRRFAVEGERLASLRHPGIAQVYATGTHHEKPDGPGIEVPYLVLELVEGARSLVRYANEERLLARARVRLFLEATDAVQYAHQRGLIHRDLKPANLLVGADGRLKVIDFGVACATAPPEPDGGAGGSDPSRAEAVGTLRYMSPEQRAGAADVDVRADVFALGVVLEELLLGRGADAVQDPAAIAGGARGVLEGDLRWIVELARAPERERRYASAGELAADLRRALDDRPVLAAPAGTRYRLAKLVRRHRVAALLTGLAALALVVGTAGLAVGFVTAERHRRHAETAAREAEAVVDFLQHTIVAAQPWHAGPELTVVAMVEAMGPRIDVEFKDQPGVAAALHATIGWTLRGLGRPLDAEPHLRRARETLTELDGNRGRQRLVAAHYHAFVLNELGRVPEAEALLSEVAPLAEEELGERDDLTLALLDLHGCTLSTLGRHEEAIAQLERACDASLAAFGADAKGTIARRNNLVSVLSKAQRRVEAEREAKRNVDAMRRLYGTQSLDTLVTQQNHAALLALLGRHDESEAETREVLAGRGPLLGEDHPHNLISRYWLGMALQGQGRHEEAAEVHGTAEVASRERLGADHPHTLQVALGWAEATAAQGDAEAAAEKAREVLLLCPADDPVRRVPRDRARALLDRLAPPPKAATATGG